MPTREEMNSLAQHIIASYDSRTDDITNIRGETEQQLRNYDRAHNAMAQELRTELARVQPALDQAETARKQDEAQRAQDRDRVVAQRKSDVSDQLNELHNTQAGARDSWQNMAATMRQRRTGAVAEAPVVVEEEAPAVVEEEAPVAVAEAAPPVVEDATGPEVAEEEAVERAEVGDVTDEFTALSDQVFEHLASHPDGTRLTELEAEFGMKRFQAGRVVRHLMDDGKVEKQDLLYFAI